jgi:L-arabinose isomerase
MCDLYADFTDLIRDFGVNIELLEIADLRACVEQVDEQAVKAILRKTESLFDIDPKATEQKLAWCNRVAAAMGRFAADRQLDALAYHHNGFPDSVEERIASSMTLGGSLLTAEGIPCVAEGDVVVTIPMLILRSLGAGASQTEINVADFEGQIIYFSHSGPGDLSIAQDRPYLKWLDFFHGRRGSGVSCQFSLKRGPVTFLSLSKGRDGRYRFIATQGQAGAGKHLENGNVNTRVEVSAGIEQFIEQWTRQGPTHHGAIGTGHHIRDIEKIARVLGVELVVV